MYKHPTTTQDDRSDVYVSVDIANVGALWARDPDLTWEALNQLEGLLETMAEDMGGTIIDADGDAFILLFTEPAPAIMWCARMQEGLLTLDWPANLSANFDATGAPDMLFGGLLARMAIHAGNMDTLQGLVTLTQPGQVLMSDQAKSMAIQPIPPDLQIHELGSSMIHGQSTRIHHVTTRLLSRRRFGELRSRSTTIERRSRCFIDRPSAMSDLRERIESGSRLVNLTGPAGVGKTRLAHQWAWQFENTEQGEVGLVHLKHASDETDLHIATGTALGLSLSNELGGNLQERIGHAIASRGPLILILDDFPHHIGTTSLSTWLHAAPDTRLLVTSRDPISSSHSTHLQMTGMTKEGAEALFLARSHRILRGGVRPTHASSVSLPDHLEGWTPRAVEQAAGDSSEPTATPALSTMKERRLVLDKNKAPQDRIDAAFACIPMLRNMGMGDVAIEILETIQPLIQAALNPAQEAQWRGNWADILIESGRLSEAQNVLENSECDDVEWTLRHSKIALVNGEFSDAVDLLKGTSVTTPEIAFTLGQAFAGAGDWDDAVPHLEYATQKFTNVKEQSFAWSALGRVLADLGQDARSDIALKEAVRLNPNDPRLFAEVQIHRFESASARLDLETAHAHLKQATTTLLKCGDRNGAAHGLTQLGILRLIQHEPETAQRELGESRAICREDGLPVPEARALLAIGVGARMQGDLGTALDAFAEAAALGHPDPGLCGLIHAHRGATEAACDAIENASLAFEKSEALLAEVWDPLSNTIHDVLLGFVDLARAREAALHDRTEDVESHVDLALNRLARASSFETRSTPPRGRETPSRINELRLARLLLDYALSNLSH